MSDTFNVNSLSHAYSMKFVTPWRTEDFWLTNNAV